MKQQGFFLFFSILFSFNILASTVYFSCPTNSSEYNPSLPSCAGTYGLLLFGNVKDDRTAIKEWVFSYEYPPMPQSNLQPQYEIKQKPKTVLKRLSSWCNANLQDPYQPLHTDYIHQNRMFDYSQAETNLDLPHTKEKKKKAARDRWKKTVQNFQNGFSKFLLLAKKRVFLKRLVKNLKKGHKNRIDEIENQKTEFAENLQSKFKENIYKNRSQKRLEAFQNAIDNGFRIRLETYDIENHTEKLLEKHNINVGLFRTCLGNEIQQRFHAEFVEVLNRSAELTNIDLALNTDLWFSTISNLSNVGCLCNRTCQTDVTQRLSDICFGFYQLGCAANLDSNMVMQSMPNDLETVWAEVQDSLTVFRETWKAGGDAVADFMFGVQQKAFGRPAECLSQFLYSLKHNPEIVLRKIGDILLDCAQCSLETAQLLPALAFDTFSEKTTKLIFEFDQNWIVPLLKKIEPAGQAFYEMSFKEKSQEVIALGLQVVSAVGAAKISTALAAEASLGWTTLGLKLNQLSQVSASTFNTTISSSGGATVVLPAVEVITEELVGAAGQVVAVGTGIGAQAELATEVAANVLFAANASGAERQGDNEVSKGSQFGQSLLDAEVQKKIEENTKALEEMEKKGIKVDPEYRRLALEGKKIIEKGRKIIDSVEHVGITSREAEELKNIFWDTLGGENTLKRLGLEKAIIDEQFIKHFTSPQITKMVSRSGNVSTKLTGGHVLDKKLLQNGAINFEVIKNGFIKEGILSCRGLEVADKTIFPVEWTRKDVVIKVAESIKKVAENTKKIPSKIPRYIESFIEGKVKVITVIDQCKSFLTSFPKI